MMAKGSLSWRTKHKEIRTGKTSKKKASKTRRQKRSRIRVPAKIPGKKIEWVLKYAVRGIKK